VSRKIDYHKSVNYDIADPAKVLAQKEGRATAKNMPFGYREVDGTRGESAYVFDMGSQYGALVQEGLGTKSLIAQEIYKKTDVSHFDAIAQDTVATVINDLISVGATPVVMNAYWSSSSYDWLADQKLTRGFIKGWRKACDKAGVTWGGGETQALSGVVEKGVLELAGCGFGVIKPKKLLVQDKNLKAGDAILLLESSGVHANGISLAREIAKKLPKGYQTKIGDGRTFGAALLAPTVLYAKFLQECFKHNIKIHYLSNITGHGWRKIMRGTPKLTYLIEHSPTPSAEFDFIQQHSGNDLKEMYGNYNMGVGYAVYLPMKDAIKAQEVAKKLRIKSWIAGHIEKGPKQVIIKDKDITFGGESLGVR
jgi:phosphoribosylformylglycinamidine cyclo-ligase